MGNGAAVGGKYEIHGSLDDFTYMERKCKSGYFKNNVEDYLEATTRAIKGDEMDVLELLISGGDISQVYPLHIAAKYSSIESLELLLSARISPYLQDKNGRTALHIAAANAGGDAVLCVYALILAGNRGLKMKDRTAGNTPLHIAIIANNINVVDILIKYGASLSVTNAAGHSPRHLAESMRLHHITALIDAKRTEKQRAKVAASRPQYTSPAPPQPNMERIMAVWERFFENALSGVDFSLEEEGGGGGTTFTLTTMYTQRLPLLLKSLTR